jgi:hypothetical protein
MNEEGKDGSLTLETSREVDISSDLSVDLDEALSGDLDNLASGKSVLESVSDEHDEGQALAELVRTSRGTWSPGTSELVKHPVLGGGKALQMLLGTSGLKSKKCINKPNFNSHFRRPRMIEFSYQE